MAAGNLGGFGSQKQEILLLLKRRPDSTLAEVAKSLGISKVATLRHIASLEKNQLVERSYRTNGVGRPRVHFRLGPDSRKLFPEAYTEMSLAALGFIEERLGREQVVGLLQQRATELGDRYRGRFRNLPLEDRVEQLARVRDEGGYMAEVGTRRRGTTEMREHNCPILAIAGKYPEACDVERRMFESLLRANVEVSHRVVAGDPVCRFLVRPKDRDP